MLIDWFTVGAQVLNFVILVWLLKRFLYKPILDAIDAREQKIAKELADAAAKQAEAQKERAEFNDKNEKFDRQRTELWNKVTSETEAERQRLLDAARQDADALSAKRREALRSDAHNLNQAISRKTQQEVFSIARRTLTDLAGADLDQRVSEIFMQRLRGLSGDTKNDFGKALQSSKSLAVVRSAFDLPPSQRSAIQTAINETFAADIHLAFETAPDLVSGIELATDGHKMSWSIAEYLTSLEKSVAELFKEKDATTSAADAKTDPAGQAVKPDAAPKANDT